MKTVNITIKSINPMLMHSDRTANPLNSFAKELKKITGKRKKTDEDHEEISRIEFIAGLYHDELQGYHIPSANIEACLLASAKHTKRGTLIKQAMIIESDASFVFPDSKKTPEALYQMGERYKDMRTVKVGTAKTIRTRPLFREWESTFSVLLDTDKMNVDELIDIVSNAGRYVGLGDYRPKFGRFETVDFTVNK